MSKTTNKFAPEVRARAVRMVLDHESEPAPEAGPQFAVSFEGVELDALVFHRSPKALNEHVVHPSRLERLLLLSGSLVRRGNILAKRKDVYAEAYASLP